MDSFIGQDSSKEVCLHFVVPTGLNEQSCSVKLQTAFKACVDMSFVCEWTTERQVVAMSPRRRDVFICDSFEGEAFEHVASEKFKCVVLGAQCLLSCLTRCEPVPDLGYPLYTTGMRGLVVTSTGFDRPEKCRIQRLVRMMSGVYSNDFHEGVTHLVAAIVASAKYQVAVDRGVPVLRACWVDAVWQRSCDAAPTAADTEAQQQQLLTECRCGVLQGLSVCVSQLARKDKELLRRIITDNGGTYMAQLECDKTRVLVTPSVEGDKTTFARKWQIPCVVPDWLYDSVERGVCLPTESYNVFHLTTLASTPSKKPGSRDGLDNLSVSCIQADEGARQVDESILSNHPCHNSSTMCNTVTSAVSTDAATLAELDGVDVNDQLSTEPFLDGCKVHMYGFSGGSREDKLRRLLNSAGAVRLRDITTASHVLLAPGAAPPPPPAAAAGDDVSDNRQLVSVGWLLASRRAGRPLPLSPPHPPPQQQGDQTAGCISSAAAEAVAVDDTTLLCPPPPLTQQQQQQQQLLSSTTLRNNVTDDGANCTALPSPAVDRSETEDAQGVFAGAVFELCSRLEPTRSVECRRLLNEHGATIVGSASQMRAMRRFIVVPLIDGDDEGEHDQEGARGVERVTLTYLQHCVEMDQLLEVQYYHRAVRVRSTAATVLSGCVLAVSGYSGRQRQYLALLAESMSAVFQEVFARRDNAARSIRASTLLVCPVSAGDSNKCLAARRWRLPIVDCRWLLACAAEGRRVDTKPYEVPAAAKGVGSVGGAASLSTSVTSMSCAAAGTPEFMRRPPPVTPVRPPPESAAPAASVNSTPAASGDLKAASPGGTAPQSSSGAWKRFLESVQTTDNAKKSRQCRRVSTPMSQLVLRFFDNLPQEGATGDCERNNNVESSSCVTSAQQVQAEILREAGVGTAPDNISCSRSVADGSLMSTTKASVTSVTSVTADNLSRHMTDEAKPLAGSTALTSVTTSCVSRQLEELQQLVERRHSDVMAAAAAGGQAESPPTAVDAPVTVEPMTMSDSQGVPCAHDVDTQEVDVMWTDRRDYQARRRLLAHAADSADLTTENNNNGQLIQTDRQVAPVFAFSGLDSKERQRLCSAVRALGARVSEAAWLESDVTHLVTSRPSRSEKHLACIAAGRWMLRPEYVRHCVDQQRLVQAESSEWGADSNNDMPADSVEKRVALAAHMWRIRVQQKGVSGAFGGMVAVVLTAGDERRRAFERLVTTGGGRCMTAVPDDTAQTTCSVTHVFLEPGRTPPPADPAWWRRLVEWRVPCLLPIYLNEFLMSSQPPSLAQFYVDQYRSFLDT